jgi:D-glycero-alpha-D-manno-heptose-7-phosphate kinase
LADVPAGTGLGSSGSFTTALIKALYTHRKNPIYQKELAELACKIEIEILKEPIGKQDQYIASFGGMTCFDFKKNDDVNIQQLKINKDTIQDLEDNLLLFFTGYTRSASDILKDQNDKTQVNDVKMIENLHYVKKLGFKIKDALEKNDTNKFGEYMHEHWENKKIRSNSISTSEIDTWYQIGLQNGAIGGKVVGAGGGGFLMFMAHDKDKLRYAMKKLGLSELNFSFDFEGTRLI